MEYSSSTTKTLQAPLLGVKPDELDEEHHVRRADIAVLVNDVHDDADDDDDDEEEVDDDSYCYDVFIIWFALPFLLFVQFGVAFVAQDEATRNLSWSFVNVSIVLFALTVWLYRESCIDSKIESCLLVLLPEIILNTVLILVLINKTPVAFYMLLLGMELLSVLAIIATVRFLYNSRRGKLEQENEDKEKKVFKGDYILIV
jgi:hypothetical protein